MVAFIENTLRVKVSWEIFDESLVSRQNSSTFPLSKFCVIWYRSCTMLMLIPVSSTELIDHASLSTINISLCIHVNLYAFAIINYYCQIWQSLFLIINCQHCTPHGPQTGRLVCLSAQLKCCFHHTLSSPAGQKLKWLLTEVARHPVVHYTQAS